MKDQEINKCQVLPGEVNWWRMEVTIVLDYEEDKWIYLQETIWNQVKLLESGVVQSTAQHSTAQHSTAQHSTAQQHNTKHIGTKYSKICTKMPAPCTFTKIYQHIGDWLKIVSTALCHAQVIVYGRVSSNKKRKLNHTSKEVKRSIIKKISCEFKRRWCNTIQYCEIHIRIEKKNFMDYGRT